MTQVTENSDAGRFELREAGALAFADVRREAGRMIVSHVEAAPSLRGTGAAGRLMEGVLAAARHEGLSVVPLCGYAAAYIRRHREHHDLLA